MQCHVYILKHPETLAVIYVGSTFLLKQRESQHRSKYNITKGFTPLFEVIESFKDDVDAERFEFLLIKKYIKEGVILDNKYLARGGKKPRCVMIERIRQQKARYETFKEKEVA